MLSYEGRSGKDLMDEQKPGRIQVFWKCITAVIMALATIAIPIYTFIDNLFTHVIHVEVSDFKPVVNDKDEIQFQKMDNNHIGVLLEADVSIRNDKESSVRLERAYFPLHKQEPDTEANRRDMSLCYSTTVETSKCFNPHDNPYIISAGQFAEFNIRLIVPLTVNVTNTLKQLEDGAKQINNQPIYLSKKEVYDYLQSNHIDLYGIQCAYMIDVDGTRHLVYNFSDSDIRFIVTYLHLDFDKDKKTETLYGCNTYDSMYLQNTVDGNRKLLTHNQYLDVINKMSHE